MPLIVAGQYLPLLVNIAAFAWAMVLAALAMLAPLAVFGSGILGRIP